MMYLLGDMSSSLFDPVTVTYSLIILIMHTTQSVVTDTVLNNWTRRERNNYRCGNMPLTHSQDKSLYSQH